MPDRDTASPLAPIRLTQVEARILGCLMEKQRSTPDQYPLTLNALTSACNQKSSRHPIMSLELGEVGHTVNGLRDRGLIHAGFAGRTERYDHKMVGTFHLSREEQAVLAVLMLRGPQTLGELRTNTNRLAEFADLDAVAATLSALAERSPPLALELPRTPGRREERFVHLLCGEPSPEDLAPAPSAPAGRSAAAPGGEAQGARIAALEQEVAGLRAELDRLWELTGLAERRDG
jgi:uncharacterized protein YceH (UPF0502 family)